MKLTTKLWLAIAALAVLSPLGLLIPAYFKAGSAWGEWGAEEIEGLVGYIPRGLEKLSSFWKAPLPDYAFKGWEGRGLLQLSLSYVVSAIIGVAAVVILTRLFTKK
ncbi:MAG: PDGLE domain-containing protein [Candidatus Omnitrophota bacterium]